MENENCFLMSLWGLYMLAVLSLPESLWCSLTNILSAASNSCSLNLEPFEHRRIYLLKHKHQFLQVLSKNVWYNSLRQIVSCCTFCVISYYVFVYVFSIIEQTWSVKFMWQPSVKHAVRNPPSCLPEVWDFGISITQNHLSDVEQKSHSSQSFTNVTVVIWYFIALV